MRLGGTVAGRFSTPEEWEGLLRQSHFKAVTAPFTCHTPKAEIAAYCAAAKRQGAVIAEAGLNDGRSVLLVEQEEKFTATEGTHNNVTIYCRADLRLKKIGEFSEYDYANNHMIGTINTAWNRAVIP